MAIKAEVEFKKYQVQGVNFMLAHNYILNSDEMGLGKTLQSIAVQQASDDDCLIICPKTLRYNWLEEYGKFTDEEDIAVGLRKAKVNIIHYEALYKATELFQKAKTVIIDEAHYLIDLDSQRTTLVHRMVSKYQPERLILLTGTPVKERVPDFYSLLKLLSYTPIPNNGRKITDKFPTHDKFSNYFSNREDFRIMVKGRYGKSFPKQITKFSGTKNETELKEYLKFKYIRRVADKVLDLPPVIFKSIPVDYSENPELEAAFLDYMKTGDFNVSIKVKSAVATAPFTAEYVMDLLKGGNSPVIVFSEYKEPIRIIAESLKRYKLGFITGDEKSESRDKARIDFQEGKLDVILCTYKAGSVGINLTRSRNMVLNDETWDASDMFQALKRFNRIGQTGIAIVHRIFGSNAAKRTSELLESKRADISKII